MELTQNQQEQYDTQFTGDPTDSQPESGNEYNKL